MARADRLAQGTSCASRKPYPSSSGATHVVLEPLDFMARLAALVPRPRLNLTRFHGVLAPNFKHRAQIVPRRARCTLRRLISANHPDDIARPPAQAKAYLYRNAAALSLRVPLARRARPARTSDRGSTAVGRAYKGASELLTMFIRIQASIGGEEWGWTRALARRRPVGSSKKQCRMDTESLRQRQDVFLAQAALT
jgi:hypothetical protein